MARVLDYRTVLAAFIAVSLTGCSVGPDFHRPTLDGKARYQPGPAPTTVTQTSLTGQTMASQTLNQGADVEGEWWTLFGVPELNTLVARARANNPTLQSAQTTLKAAWEQAKVQAAPMFPSISAMFNPTRNKTTRALSPVPGNNSYLYNLHTLQLNISYQPDLWGGLRRQMEAAAAQAEVERFQLEAMVNTIINSLLVAVLQQASANAQIAVLNDQLTMQKDLLHILQERYRLGDVALADVLAQQTVVTNTAASLPPLKLQAEQAHDQIATLVGVTPDEVLPEPRLDEFHLPQNLPVSLPSQLLEQRPDVRAAEAQMHINSAQVGVAIANRLPNVQLSATPGQAVNAMSQFFAPGSGNWQIGAMLAQPLFQGFQLWHLEREARDTLLASSKTYRATVLDAIQNVADALHALQDDADTLSATQQSDATAQQSVKITHAQNTMGDVSVAMMMTIQQQALQARQALVQARVARFSDTVGLFQALGGGWWHRNDSGMKDQPATWQGVFTAAPGAPADPVRTVN
ncbi:efflux transporter outer membrane subunit [Acetobacter sp. TBRC 12305]|uniref:Efflux transporter outer membrane subunit n=1 Tax=Acetobacter garciniae TaxID=2817435 RepID=A0A939HL06_9PROT|nr:efflux transporter outer membrane subunit [Acetobacter garciniae]MBO1324675.1 efflux transporter outer membrane subunit [Acetobacter garciniae]MBX0344365.1 efflux transporter outer membrane subunit [Acetobacter garciniae]